MALSVAQYEEMAALVAEVGGLVDRLEARDPTFAEGVLDWLTRVEVTFERNRLPAVSNVASARAALIGAKRGVATIDVTYAGRPTVRKLALATASVVLQRGNELVHDAMAERRAVFNEAERIALQTVAVADAKRFVPDEKPGRGRQVDLEALRERIERDPDLASTHLHLVSLVGRRDVLVFLDRALAAHGVGRGGSR